jgi:hypothetical protein
MFHSCWRAHDGQTKSLLDIFRARSVGICSLYNANLELLRESSFSGKIADERRCKSCDSVTVKKAEAVLGIIEVVNEAIGITVKRTATLVVACL